MTFPSTTAAACSRASNDQHADLVASSKRLTGNGTVELVEIFELQAVGCRQRISVEIEVVEFFR